MPRPLPIALLCSFLFASHGLAAPAASPAPSPRHVLLIHSFGREFSPLDAVAQEFQAVLSAQSPLPVEFSEASLERARLDGPDREQPLIEFLAAIHQTHPPDLVVPLGAPAVLFCHRNRARLFPSAPTLAVGADKRRIAPVADQPWLTSVSFAANVPLFARNITSLLPDTKHLFVVFGTAPVDQFWDSETQREWPAILPGVEIHWLSHLPLASICQTLASTPPRSAVFHGIMTRDAAGALHEHEVALAAVRAASKAPVFGFSTEQIGGGIVGGPLLSIREVGRSAAHVALRLLSGASPADITTPSIPQGLPTYDWRELQRWGIPASRLPAQHSILFKPPGLWQSNRTAVLTTIAVVTTQSALIIALLAARRRARDNMANLRLTTEAASVGLWQDAPDGRNEIIASPEWRAIFGFPPSGPIPYNDVINRIHPDDRRTVLAMAGSNHSTYDLEHRIILPDGSTRWIASRGSSDRPGTPSQRPRRRGVSLDITDRRHSEAELARQRGELAHLARAASLGELSAALAHELNQPLGSILSNAQAAQHLIATHSPDLAELRDILSDIVSEDRRASNVIVRLRSLLERGDTLPVPVNLHDCIDDALNLLKNDLLSRNIHVVRNFSPDLPHVMAERVHLQQLLLNLITNAAEAMDAVPTHLRTLTFSSSLHQNSIQLDVADSGTGFSAPPESLFQPFHSSKPRGLGMGLAICRTIAEAHRGQLTAESSQGSGAVFHLSLPAAS
jgi:C4-dicarboxylate-specific signal transduction histidine kinase